MEHADQITRSVHSTKYAHTLRSIFISCVLVQTFFTKICQGYLVSTEVNVRLPQCKWSSPVGLWYIGYLSEIRLKFKSHEISLVHNISISFLNVLKFCSEHGSITAKFQNDSANVKYVMAKQTLRFEFKMRFGRISRNAQGPRLDNEDKNPLVTGGLFSQRPVAWSFDVYFDVRLNKQLSN